MSNEEETPLEFFMDVEGVSRQSFLISIDPHEAGMINIIVHMLCFMMIMTF